MAERVVAGHGGDDGHGDHELTLAANERIHLDGSAAAFEVVRGEVIQLVESTGAPRRVHLVTEGGLVVGGPPSPDGHRWSVLAISASSMRPVDAQRLQDDDHLRAAWVDWVGAAVDARLLDAEAGKAPAVATGAVAEMFANLSSRALAGAGLADAMDREHAVELTNRVAELRHDAHRSARAALLTGAGVAATGSAVGSAGQGGLGPLLHAMTVAAAADQRTVTPPVADVELDRLAPVDAIAAASDLPIRRVRLTGRWWRDPAQPLVAWTLDAHPVAVVPGQRRYELVGPATGVRRKLDRKAAAELRPEAVAFDHALTGTGGLDAMSGLVRGGLRGSGRDAARVIGLALVGAVVGLVLPVTTGIIFARVVPSGDRERLAALLVVTALATMSGALLQLARGRSLVRLRDRFDGRTQPALMRHLLSLPPTFFARRSSGQLAEQVLTVDAQRAQLDDAMLTSLLTAGFAMVNLGVMIAVDRRMGVVGVGVAFLTLGLSTSAQLWGNRPWPLLLEARARIAGITFRLVHAVTTLRVAGAEDRAFAHWAGANVEQLRLTSARIRAYRLTETIDRAWPTVGTFAVVAAASTIPPEELSPAAFMTFTVAFLQVVSAVLMLSSSAVAISEVRPLLAQSLVFVSEASERRPGDAHPGVLHGELQLSAVVFRYEPEQPPVFDGLSLHVPAGELLAVVGPSGSGKSTLLRLLLGFEHPDEGVVAYDGHDLATLDVAAVRRQLGVVMQQAVPLGATVRDAIAGSRPLDDERIWELAAMVGLDDDLRRMRLGLLTPMGERGTRLSGGQRQRIAVARALAGEPRVVLLDEATSALDHGTQAIVNATIDGLGVTRVVVAHRLSTVERADRVAVIARGQIVEIGPPGELRRAGGHFARLAARQLA